MGRYEERVKEPITIAPVQIPERLGTPLRFQPLDPDNEIQVAELRRQRMLCGWGLDSVDKWLEMIRKGDRVG